MDRNKAIEIVRSHYPANKQMLNEALETLVPELKESEDEMIRKAIHIYLDWLDGRKDYQPKGEYTIRDMIAWLKKQGQTFTPKDVDNAYLKGVCDAKHELEKQGEKSQDKPANNAEKVEPKFHKGDWVVCEVTGSVYQIKDCIENLSNHKYGYDLTNGDYIGGDEVNHYHLWTIQEAKDGDVLVNGSNIFIFSHLSGTRAMGYCHVNLDDGKFYDDRGDDECFGLIDAVFTPANDERRACLFAKMKEAGYEWDAEKKELRKVMTIEENLLLKGHCARLPYGVVLHHIPSGENTTLEFIGQGVIDWDIHDVIENFKPYLRRMSSMTEEEREEYDTWHEELEEGRIKDWKCAEFIDWLNKKRFAYRYINGNDMFESGLALEAPKGMYNQK